MPQSPAPNARTTFGQALHQGLSELASSKRMSAQQLEVIYALAYAHVAQHQYAQALPLFAFLSQYGATRKHYLSGLALCLQMVGRYDEAVCIYSLIGTLYPGTPDVALRVAECQLAKGDAESARAELARVLELAGQSDQHGQARVRAQALLDLTAHEGGT